MSESLSRLYALRNNVLKKENGQIKFLLANFTGTKQQKDIEYRTPLIEDFFRTKIDVKYWRSKEDYRKDNPDFDWNDKDNVMQSIAMGFDYPCVARYNIEKSNELDKGLNKYDEVFVYQLKACNLHCPYCFVDDFNKDGKNSNNARFFSAPEIVDEFQKEQEKRKKENLNQLYRIRASGGEPTIAPEQLLHVPRELEKRGLSDNVNFHIDTNTTTGQFIEELERKGEIEKNLLEKVGEYKNVIAAACFKGADEENFAENTRANGKLFGSIAYSFKKFIRAHIDTYISFYNPNPDTLEDCLDNLAGKFGDGIYLKSWVFPLKLYGPEKERLGNNAEGYAKELEYNFKRSEEVMQNLLLKKFNVEYKKQLRTGIELKGR